MVKQKKEKPELKDLQEAIDEIKQRFGEGAIMSLKDVRAVDVDVIPKPKRSKGWTKAGKKFNYWTPGVQ